jgi:hypothetical protein
MKKFILLLFVAGSSAVAQNYKTATTQKWTQNGWEDVRRTVNNLNPDGTVKDAIMQYWDPAPTSAWRNITRTSYTYNANDLPTVMLLEIYDTGNNAWKYDQKVTTAYGTGTTVLSVLTETNVSGTTFMNHENRTYVYTANLLTGIDVSYWQSSTWLQVQTITYTYNPNGTTDTINVQVLDTATGKYPTRSRLFYSYYAAGDTMVHQYWKNNYFENFIRVNTHYLNGKIDFVTYDYYNETNSVWDKDHKVSSIYNGNVLIQELTQAWNVSSNNYIENFQQVLYTYDGIVGIQELLLEAGTPAYFDLYGNTIEKRYNEVMIEKNGAETRKVIIQR